MASIKSEKWRSCKVREGKGVSLMPDDLGFIDPTEGAGEAKILMAPRPMDLAGKVVGLLDNTKEQADVILETLGTALREH
jgi:hypothetical protein